MTTTKLEKPVMDWMLKDRRLMAAWANSTHDMDDEAAMEVLRLAQATALLRAFKQGLEPQVDERGKIVPSAEDFAPARQSYLQSKANLKLVKAPARERKRGKKGGQS